MSGNTSGAERAIPSIDYGAGPRPLASELSASRTTRPDGRDRMSGWIHDRAREIATRSEVVVIPARRKR